MSGWFVRRLALLVGLALTGGLPSSADAIELHRGINFELWQHWTAKAEFTGAGYDRANFPDWSDKIDDQQLAAVHRQGFDFVRLNIDPSPFFWAEKDGNRMLDGVMTATRRLQAAGLKVVVDLHLVPDQEDRPNGLHWVLGTGDQKKAAGFSRYADLVSRFAKRLADLPADATALELMNEPDQDWFSYATLTDRWPGQLGTLYATARKAAPSLPLILAGGRGGGIEGLLRLDPTAIANDANTLWTFHIYDPYAITHSGLPWETSPEHFLVGLPYPAALLDFGLRERLIMHARAQIDAEITDDGARAELYAKVDEVADKYRASDAGPDKLAATIGEAADWANKYGIAPNRLLVGEFGVFQDHVDVGTRCAILKATREAAEARGMSWAVYAAGLTQPGQSFSIIVDAATLRVEPAVATALGLTPTAD